MTETLFGGLIAVVILFFVARTLRLSIFWSSFAAAMLPLAVYLFISLGAIPEGDILAIHFVLYIITAVVLGVYASIQKVNRMHWAPRLITGFFVFLVIFNAALLSISSHGLPIWLGNILLPNPQQQTLHTAFPGLIPHDRNKLYEPHLQELEAQKALGWQVSLQGLDQLRHDVASNIVLIVRDKNNAPLQADKATLSLLRMANSLDDHRISLEQVEPGRYQTKLNLPDAGRWIVELEITRGADHFLMQEPIFIQ